jgi:RecA-family ATPase
MTDFTQLQPLKFSEMMDGPMEIDWLVDGIVPCSTSGIMAGEPGVGKTWIVMDLVMAIATGSPWLDKYETIESRVLVIDEENADILVRQRYHSLNWRYDSEKLENIHFLIGESLDVTPLEHPRKGLADSTDYLRLWDLIDRYRYDLVVVDSLTRFHHTDENDSSRMSAVFDGIKRITDKFKISFLFTHHFNKGRGHNNNRLRGSSDILAFPDYVLRVQKDKMHQGIDQSGVVIEHGKSRWGVNVGKIPLRLEDKSHDVKKIERLSGDDLKEAILTYIAVARTTRDIIKEMEGKGLGAQTAVKRELKSLKKSGLAFEPNSGVYQATGAYDLENMVDGLLA